MKDGKWEKLRKLGYRVMDTQEFLGLSDEEMALIDLKISLIEKLRNTCYGILRFARAAITLPPRLELADHLITLLRQ